MTVSPATRRLWTASLIAVFALACVSARPAMAQAQVVIVTEPEGVNLRGGPGTHFISLAVIPKGAELPVLGPTANDNWIPVSYQGKLGFVFDEYVDVKTVLMPATTALSAPLSLPGVAAGQATGSTTASAIPSPSASPSGAPAQLRVNSSDGLNLRAAPTTDARILTVIPNATRVTVTSRTPDGKWAAVAFGGQSGWVDSQYLVSLDSPVERPEAGCGPAATPAPSVLPTSSPSGALSVATTAASTPVGSAATVSAGPRYMWPVCGRSITTYFGPSHLGIDIDQYPVGGNPVMAVAAGKVSFAGGNPCCSYGLYVKVEHRDGTVSLYAHLQTFDVREGQEVVQGQSLGKSGNTGFSTGAHLHFELHINGSPVDPMGQLTRP